MSLLTESNLTPGSGAVKAAVDGRRLRHLQIRDRLSIASDGERRAANVYIFSCRFAAAGVAAFLVRRPVERLALIGKLRTRFTPQGSSGPTASPARRARAVGVASETLRERPSDLQCYGYG